MTADPRLVALAKRVIDTNRYLTLGTVDADGQPWVSPVYFTPEAYTHFYWVSSPEARHSRNLAEHPGLSIVVYDSSVPKLRAPTLFRLYRATVSEHSVLIKGRDPEYGTGVDTRMTVSLA